MRYAAIRPHDRLSGFPSPYGLAERLCIANSKLSNEDSSEYTRNLIAANAAGDFELAWKLLDTALNLG